MTDPYEILEVPTSAGKAEIKKAYRRLARELHPDRDPGNPDAEERFKELSAAYEILSDQALRDKFDRGEIDTKGFVRTAQGSGRASHPKRKHAKPGDPKKTQGIKIKGADVEYQLKAKFLEAARGGVKYVSTTNGKRLKVTLPAGTRDEQILRLKGQGMPGIGGGKAGDALVEIAVEPDHMFNRDDTDIHIELSVDLPTAVLGGRVEAPTVNGMVTLTVPPKSNTGRILRLKGKGLPSGSKGKGEKGDQYVILKVVLPKKMDKEFVEFVEDWAAKNGYPAGMSKAD